MREFSLLSRADVFGENKSKIFTKRGVTSDTTDYGIITGADVIEDHKKYKGIRIGKYWIDGFQKIVTDDRDWWRNYEDLFTEVIRAGGWKNENAISDNCGIRLKMKYSSLEELQKNKGSVVKRCNDGIIEIEYGYYPQKVIDRDFQEYLEVLYKGDKLKKTGNIYSTYKPTRINGKIKENCENEEFEYNGKRYVRFDVKKNYYNTSYEAEKYMRNSKGELYDYVWVEVEPVKWLVDEKAKMLVTEKIILGGVPYKSGLKVDMTQEGYRNTIARRFINNFIEKELFSCELEKINQKELESDCEIKSNQERDDYER